MTRSFATRRAILNTPASSASRSCPTTVATSSPARDTAPSNSSPSSTARAANASLAKASTSAVRAAPSSQSHTGL